MACIYIFTSSYHQKTAFDSSSISRLIVPRPVDDWNVVCTRLNVCATLTTLRPMTRATFVSINPIEKKKKKNRKRRKVKEKEKSGESVNKFDLDLGLLDCEAGFGYHVTDTPHLRIF